MQVCANICSPANCERVATNWRAIPAVLVLAASIVMFVAMLFAKKYLLLIPPGVCILFSLYNIYIGCEFAALKTHSELNDDHRAENATYANENVKLKRTATELQTEVSSLKADRVERDRQNAELQEKLDTFERNNKALQERIAEVGLLTSTEAVRLSTLHEGINTAKDQALAQLAICLKGIVDHMGSLKQQTTILESNSDTARQQTEKLESAAKTFAGLAETIDKFNTEKDATHQLFSQMLKSQDEMSKTAERLAAMRAELATLSPVVKDLSAVRDGFSTLLQQYNDSQAGKASTEAAAAVTAQRMEEICRRIEVGLSHIPPTPSAASGRAFDFSNQQEGQPGATPPRIARVGNVHGFASPGHVRTSSSGTIVVTASGGGNPQGKKPTTPATPSSAGKTADTKPDKSTLAAIHSALYTSNTTATGSTSAAAAAKSPPTATAPGKPSATDPAKKLDF